MMHVKFNSTRYTPAGKFRAGHVYAIDPKDDARLRAVAPHIESKVAEKLTEKQAAEAKAEMIKLAAPAGEGEGAPAKSEKGKAKE